MNFNKSCWLYLILVISQPASAMDTLKHHRISVGESFLFTVNEKLGGKKETIYAPRLDAWNVNKAGGVIFTVEQGPKGEVKPSTILRTVYAIDTGECATDLLTGTSLLNGEACASSTPMKESWTFTGANKRSYSCKLLQPLTENLSLASGDFETVRIECVHQNNAYNTVISIYWYAASIGAMAKSEERTLDANGTELALVKAELVSYQNDQ